MAQPGGVQFTLSEIAARLGGDVLGDGQTLIRRIATLASADAGDITFLANRKYKSQLQSTQAAAVILAPDAADALRARIEHELGWPAHFPEYLEQVDLA